MSKSTLALITANAFLFGFAFIGSASADEDALIPMAFFAMTLSVINGVAAYRRSKRDPVERRRRHAPEIDEMDARTVLDIDGRLEALERREREMEEAERIQQLVARGQQSVPAEPLPQTAEAELIRDHA